MPWTWCPATSLPLGLGLGRRPRLAGGGRLEGAPGDDRLWTRAEAVGPGFAILGEEQEENDRAHQRDEGDEEPPAATPGIVEPSDGHGERGDQQRECQDTGEDADARRAVEGSGRHVRDGAYRVEDH